jgi:hypothetical protein
VIVLGGSGGGLKEGGAAALSSEGFTALALAYFGIDPLASHRRIWSVSGHQRRSPPDQYRSAPPTFHNVQRDPNVTVTIRDENDPYRYVEVRGEIVQKVRGWKLASTLTNSRTMYHGGPYENSIQSEQVMLGNVLPYASSYSLRRSAPRAAMPGASTAEPIPMLSGETEKN